MQASVTQKVTGLQFFCRLRDELKIYDPSGQTIFYSECSLVIPGTGTETEKKRDEKVSYLLNCHIYENDSTKLKGITLNEM